MDTSSLSWSNLSDESYDSEDEFYRKCDFCRQTKHEDRFSGMNQFHVFIVCDSCSSKIEKQEDFFNAISRKDLPKIKELVEMNAIILGDLSNGLTCLHIACAKGRLDIVQYLVEAGVSLEEKDTYGNTPLYYTVNRYCVCCFADKERLNKYKVIIEFLLQSGANIEFRVNGLTPLHTAIKRGYLDLVKLLVQYGADTDSYVEDEGVRRTVKDLALETKDEEIIEFLNSIVTIKEPDCA